MSLFDRFRRKQELRDLTTLYAAPPHPGTDGVGYSGGYYISEDTALQNLTVFACVRLLADSIAGLPMDVYRKQGGVRVPIDPSPSLIRQPDPSMTNFEWAFQSVESLALRGNAFYLITARDSLEYATAISPVHPDEVQAYRDPDTGSVVYKIHNERVPASDVVHIKRYPVAGQVLGLSPIDKARLGIGLSLSAEAYGARYFSESASPSSVLETDESLTEDEAQLLMKQWIASHGGKRHPAMLSGGLKWRPISITPEESQFLETRKYQRNEIAMLFGVPPHMIGDVEKTTSWGTGIEQQSIGFVQFTLKPWLDCIEDALSNLLPRGQYMQFNVDGLLRGDSKSRFESYVQARTAGWLSVNEIRALEDLPPVPNGDSYIQPMNMGPLGTDPTKDKPAGPPPNDGDPNGPQV